LERAAVLVFVAERDLSVGNTPRLSRHNRALVACNERAARMESCHRSAVNRTSRAGANRSCPMFCPLDRLVPLRGKCRRLIARHGGFEAPIDLPVGANIAFVAPIPDRESRQV